MAWEGEGEKERGDGGVSTELVPPRRDEVDLNKSPHHLTKVNSQQKLK